MLSGWAGHQVDIRNNLWLVRFCIITVKLSACGAYTGSLVLFHRVGSQPSLRDWSSPLGGAMFAFIVVCGCIQNLSAIALSVAIERDWVTVIAHASSEHLTQINTYMRRIDLLCKLLAPLFVSLLVTVTSNFVAAYIMCGVEAGCIVFELLCRSCANNAPHQPTEHSTQGLMSSIDVSRLCRRPKLEEMQHNNSRRPSERARRRVCRMSQEPYACTSAILYLIGGSLSSIRYFCPRSRFRVSISRSSGLTVS